MTENTHRPDGKPVRLGIYRRVRGDEWMRGKAAQDREWESIRRGWAKQTAGYELVTDTTETTNYDEKQRAVLLQITAEAVQL